MGCGQSKELEGSGSGSSADPGKQRNQEIEQQLKRDKALERSRIKILLLGAGESGKSTVIKQMRLMYHGTYTEEERLEYREIIWSNMLQSMQAVLDGANQFEIKLQLPQSEEYARALIGRDIFEGLGQPEQLDPDVAHAIQALWQDPAVQAVVARANEIQLNDSATYYFEECPRLASPDFLPNDQDILRSRVKTTGIQETEFKVDKHVFQIFDVGGQRSERKKWIHCFENVNVLLFLVAISEYDQMLYEDEEVSRIAEAMTLFKSIVNSRWFAKSTIMLFLNKTDLFAEKLSRSPLSQYLPEYTGSNEDYNQATMFMQKMFSRMYRPAQVHQTLYTHLTCATDTQSVKAVLQAVQDQILKERFAEAGLL